ncbi:hypothetical protein CBR_g26093 [Chara braunii]|uniref:Uncharacterized protein n=1 Tax=Chara braunii TaxID=69332 RepID=A0A388JVW8_CHABU|nr:hypothetical protein CBR_g26093 [Chara braunii]|eukprot:GBG61930.1 hypothetical protein CBR_g26093 [Chara braunii]
MAAAVGAAQLAHRSGVSLASSHTCSHALSEAHLGFSERSSSHAVASFGGCAGLQLAREGPSGAPILTLHNYNYRRVTSGGGATGAGACSGSKSNGSRRETSLRLDGSGGRWERNATLSPANVVLTEAAAAAAGSSERLKNVQVLQQALGNEHERWRLLKRVTLGVVGAAAGLATRLVVVKGGGRSLGIAFAEVEDDAVSESEDEEDKDEDEGGEGEAREGDEGADAGGATQKGASDQFQRIQKTIPWDKLQESKRYSAEEVVLVDLLTKQVIPKTDELYNHVQIRSGGLFTKDGVNEDLQSLIDTGLFVSVDAEVQVGSQGGLRVQYGYREKRWPRLRSLKLMDAPHFPKELRRQIWKEIKNDKVCTVRTLSKLKQQVEKWYHDKGFVFAQVVVFDGMDTGELVAKIQEGYISKVRMVFTDAVGNPAPQPGSTKWHVVERELPEGMQRGEMYNIEDGRKALRDVFMLQLFENVQVVPKPDESEEGSVVVDIVVKERQMKTAEVETEWSIAPGESGRPALASIQPGGSVFFEHRNIAGENRSIYGSVSTSNLFNPQDDLGFKVEYLHPYVYGDDDPARTTLRISGFNSRKLSAVFTGGPSLEEVPAVWVDRTGAKLTLTEHYTRQSRVTYGMVMEEVTTRDESSAICTHGSRALPSGAMTVDGPPTTLSDTGVDRVAFLQANVTRDNTKFVNGTPVGGREIYQLDQGVGIGSRFPFFNRHQMTITRFIQLKEVEPNSNELPPVAVLHGRYGGCVGDLASYDVFTLGGPYSVRGYNVGELAACRRFLELAAELRYPIMGKHVYGFYEYGTDLNSSKDVRGNPTEFFRRVGSGASWGCGVKLGAVRAEYARDCNAGTGALFVRFGERF